VVSPALKRAAVGETVSTTAKMGFLRLELLSHYQIPVGVAVCDEASFEVH
jgi:hypothetical protein